MKYRRKKDRDFWQLARAYLHDFMPAVRNQSDKSVAAYKQSLNSYLLFLENMKGLREEQVTFDTFNRNNIKDFVEWLREKKYAPKTINLKLTAIRSFLRYCADEDFELRGIYHDVCTVRKVKEEKKPIEYLQPAATKAILASYDTRTAKHRRNRMILILLYDTGARVQELSDLSLSSLHLDMPNPYVTLIGKGRKTRNVPVMDKTVAHLKKYLEEFHPDLTEAQFSKEEGDAYVFTSPSEEIKVPFKNDIIKNHPFCFCILPNLTLFPWHIAIARASAVSSGLGVSLSPRNDFTICCICFLSALP